MIFAFNIESIFIIAIKLLYGTGHYRPYNPCSLYDILFSLFPKGKVPDNVWNNSNIAKLEVRQILSHYSMKSQTKNF
jgi:hypothetical protein